MNEIIPDTKWFKSLRSKPSKLYYIGDISLLDKRKVSIVGSRKPNQYTQNITYQLSREFSYRTYAKIISWI